LSFHWREEIFYLKRGLKGTGILLGLSIAYLFSSFPGLAILYSIELEDRESFSFNSFFGNPEQNIQARLEKNKKIKGSNPLPIAFLENLSLIGHLNFPFPKIFHHEGVLILRC
jgi:hypothetical protein